jgi:transcriptional regulator with XRE-family HTH domain
LRRLRDEAGLTIERVAESLECSESKVSRIENGQVGASPRDVRDMAELYGLGSQQREALVQLAREARHKGWWQAYGDVPVVPAHAGLEDTVTALRMYAALLVPGLLQTRAYASAVIRALHQDLDADQLERWVELRMNRQRLLSRDDSPTLWAILDEAVLHRPIGGHSTLVAQLEHLLDLASLPNVVVQVLPFALSGYAAEGTFSILRFAEPELPDLVYQEHLTAAVYLDKRSEVESYSRVMDRVAVDALTPDETRQYLTKLAAER